MLMINVGIQHAHKDKDGTDLVVSKYLVLPIHIIMGLNVCAHLKISADPGKFLMVLNAFTLKVNVQKIQNGMEHFVIPF